VFGVAAASRNTRFQAARYGLTWAGLAPADRASFAWRLCIDSALAFRVAGERAKQTDTPQCFRLLRARGERPHSGCTAEQRDEFATPDASCHLTPLAEG
jgi:hypothetical protein